MTNLFFCKILLDSPVIDDKTYFKYLFKQFQTNLWSISWWIHPRKESSSKPQRGKQIGIRQGNIWEYTIPRNIQVGTKRETILRLQREIFVPTKYEIKIQVWNFRCGVEGYKFWRNVFPLCMTQFSSEPKNWISDIHY